jgi:hypothetical protein
MFRNLWAFGALLAMSLASPNGQAQFIANVDVLNVTTIYNDQPDNNGGAFISFCTGNQATENTIRRGLVRYEMPVKGDGFATVTRIRINMTQERVRGQGAGAPKPATLQVRRVAQPWTEGGGAGSNAACGGGQNVDGVDWNNRPATVAPVSATFSLPVDGSFVFAIDTDDGEANDGLLADFQAWMNGASNEGWEFSIVEEGDANNARLITPDAVRVEWTEGDHPEFVINPGLNDAWVNPATLGQGFFFNVYPFTAGGFFFLAWFTFDSERPLPSVEAIFGEAGHRWVTAFGAWDGDTVTLNVELTTGGVFDSTEPPVEQAPGYGTITIVFHDCDNATLTYDFPSLGLMGSMDVTRVVKDNVLVCEAAQNN